MTIIETLAKELNLKPDAVERTVALIDEGNTIPFILGNLGGIDSSPRRIMIDKSLLPVKLLMLV